jgi:hypothetical protein
MKIGKVYKITRKSGGVTITTHKPFCEYEELIRLIADEGKLLTNGEITTPCVDVESADGWCEIDAPVEPSAL